MENIDVNNDKKSLCNLCKKQMVELYICQFCNKSIHYDCLKVPTFITVNYLALHCRFWPMPIM